MDTARVLVGDHTGVIKLIDSDVHPLGTAGTGKHILNILPHGEVFWAVRQNGLIEEFDDSGQFSPLYQASSKILDACCISNNLCVTFPDGSIEFESTSLKTQQKTCSGIFGSETDLALCGTTPVELWDLNAGKQKWKGWTLKPKESVWENKCWINDREIITVTGNNEVFVYDTRAGKKPRKLVQLNAPGTTHFYPLQTVFCEEDFVYVGDSVGNVYRIDGDLKILGKTKGRSCGAVLSIFVKGQRIYSCGLDRRLMIHDARSMNLLEKKYLWQKLTKVIVIE